MVDPDNRQPVDYQRRTALLEELHRREMEDRIGLIRYLAADPQRDEMKLWVTAKALAFRKGHRELFARGEYLPLRATGTYADNLCSFARRLDSRWVVVVAPRFLTRVREWEDTELVLPEGAPTEWHDVVTGLIPASWRVADLLREFPVAMCSVG